MPIGISLPFHFIPLDCYQYVSCALYTLSFSPSPVFLHPSLKKDAEGGERNGRERERVRGDLLLLHSTCQKSRQPRGIYVRDRPESWPTTTAACWWHISFSHRRTEPPPLILSLGPLVNTYIHTYMYMYMYVHLIVGCF